MRYICDMIDETNDEIDGARNCAESYLNYKAKGDSLWEERYKEMAIDKLKHGEYLYDKVTSEIEKLIKVYTPTMETEERWKANRKYYIEQVALTKQMLAM